MSIQISESKAYQYLSTVKHPEIPDRSLVELGMIPEIKIEGNNVLVTLALPIMEVPIKQDLIDLVQKAVHEIDGEPRAQVDLTVMNADQKDAVLRSEHNLAF